MKKIFLIAALATWFYLCMCIIVNAQTKPRNPIAPPGSWATNLVRAYAFSRLDSIRVDSVKDWSSNNAWGIVFNSVAGHWLAQGTESPKYNMAGGIGPAAGELEWISINPTFSYTDQITVVQRLRITCSGSCGGSFGIANRGLTPVSPFKFDKANLDNISQNHLCMDNGTEHCIAWNLGGTVGFTTTVIMTYAGDSLRAYQDGAFKGATAQTGNITTASYTTAIGLIAEDASNYRSWLGGVLMTCIWSRVLSSSERTQIWNDPYVMFKEPTTGRRRWIVQ